MIYVRLQSKSEFFMHHVLTYGFSPQAFAMCHRPFVYKVHILAEP